MSTESTRPTLAGGLVEGSPEFRTTHWSAVLAARDGDPPESRRALEQLCARYWFPLYAFVRRQGNDHHEGQDLTQEFFARFLEKDYIKEVSAEKGRFRSFLLAAIKHFLANDWHRRHRLKRGGGCLVLPLDGKDPETLYAGTLLDHETPECLYERRWAMTVLQRVVDQLRGEYLIAGKAAIFDELKEFLAERKGTPHQEMAGRHGISVSAVGVAIHRLRQRYRELLREEIARTVGATEDIDDEIRHLITVVGS